MNYGAFFLLLSSAVSMALLLAWLDALPVVLGVILGAAFMAGIEEYQRASKPNHWGPL